MSSWLRPTDLNGVVLKEDVDVSLLRKILILHNQTSDEIQRILTESEVEKIKRLIREYGMNSTIEVKYKFGKDKKFGRVWARFSASNLWNRIKATIRGDNYIDIDMINSGTQIIYDLATKLGFGKDEVFTIANYITNREELLVEVMEKYNVGRYIAKDLFIIMNFGVLMNFQ